MSAALERTGSAQHQTPEHAPARRPEGNSATPTADGAWLEKLARHNNRIVGDERNVLLALRHAPELAGIVRFNEFALRVEFSKVAPWRNTRAGEAWTDDDDTALQAWLQERSVGVRQRSVVADSVALVARDALVHPVRSYLQSLKWDREPRLQIALADYANASGDPVYLAAIGRKFFTSAVARIFWPGAQVDHTLVLEAPQGAGKTSFVRAIAKPWVCESLPDLSSKDASIQLLGAWLVELPELAAIRRTELEAIKAFLTRTHDRYRPPYGRRTIDVARQCAFVGTTNETQYLRDASGNRRFWPVRCARFDLEALGRDRDQLWAEAVELYGSGYVWHLTDEEGALAASEQEARRYVSELESAVAEFLDRELAANRRETTMRDVLRAALNLDPSEDAERAGRLGPQAAHVMQRLGWQRIGAVGRYPNRRTVYRHA